MYLSTIWFATLENKKGFLKKKKNSCVFRVWKPLLTVNVEPTCGGGAHGALTNTPCIHWWVEVVLVCMERWQPSFLYALSFVAIWDGSWRVSLVLVWWVKGLVVCVVHQWTPLAQHVCMCVHMCTGCVVLDTTEANWVLLRSVDAVAQQLQTPQKPTTLRLWVWYPHGYQTLTLYLYPQVYPYPCGTLHPVLHNNPLPSKQQLNQNASLGILVLLAMQQPGIQELDTMSNHTSKGQNDPIIVPPPVNQPSQ